MTENIFNGNDGIQTPSDNNAALNEQQQAVKEDQETVPQELVDWVGPGKKYASVKDIYKAFPSSQTHIDTLNTRIQEMEKELASRKSAEDILKEIQQSSTEKQTPTSHGVEVNEDVLSNLVERKFTEFNSKQTQEQNLNSFKKAFSEAYGDKAAEVYENLSKETGLSFQRLNSMAAESPIAVMKLAGIGPNKSSPGGGINTSVNTLALGANKGQEPINARVNPNANSKELADGWRRAGEKVKQIQSRG